MKIANNVSLRVFCREDEDKELIISKLKLLLPFDIGKEKIRINERAVHGFGEKIIHVIRTELTKDRHVKAFLENLFLRLDEEKKTLLEQIESRLDDDLNFFIRLDKQMLLKDKFVLTDSGKCYHIRINVASFPKNRQNGIVILKKVLG